VNIEERLPACKRFFMAISRGLYENNYRLLLDPRRVDVVCAAIPIPTATVGFILVQDLRSTRLLTIAGRSDHIAIIITSPRLENTH